MPEINHQMPRAEESNIGSQPECTSLVNRTQQASDPRQWAVEEGVIQKLKSTP